MALQGAYKQFLAAPNPSLLASNASLHYITTLTTVNGSADIVKHLNNQAHDLTKKEEKFLNVVEGTDSLAVEVHSTIEFVNGGGAYLPGLDDNFLADHTVNLPIIHIVSFDGQGKIQQIRQSWDQGSLLKLIDVIGKTGRNWPIRDGKDQIKLITSSVKSTGKEAVEASKPGDERDIARLRTNSNNATRDPHATLSLFEPREKFTSDSLPAVVPPRASAKPTARTLDELFVGGDSDQGKPQNGSSTSPNGAIAKAGAGKNYGPSRLFDNDENVAPTPSPMKNSKKYQHFDFADGSDPQDAPRPITLSQAKSKHGSQWNFDDFSTPAKVVPTKVLRNNDVRHWGNSDDEVMDSPIKFKKVDKPRKDAEPHFEFVDDGTPVERRIVSRPRGAGSNNGMGLYKDNLFTEEDSEEASAGNKPSASSIADTKGRRKDFDSQFTMVDDSPATKAQPQHISEDRAKAVKMMDANWSAYDQSPNQKENLPASPTTTRPAGKGPLSEATNRGENQGIHTAGDGMGGKKGFGSRDVQYKGIATGGDGMGGKKGLGRQWGFGDESDGEEEGGRNVPGKYKTGKTQGRPQATGGDFWDF